MNEIVQLITQVITWQCDSIQDRPWSAASKQGASSALPVSTQWSLGNLHITTWTFDLAINHLNEKSANSSICPSSDNNHELGLGLMPVKRCG